MRNRRAQRGITIWGLLYVLITLGLIALVAIKSVPVYLNAYDVRTTLQAVADDPDLRRASAGEIQQAVQRRFDAGYVDNLSGRDVAVERAGDGRREIVCDGGAVPSAEACLPPGSAYDPDVPY